MRLFQNKCLLRMVEIFWPRIMNYMELIKKTGVEDLDGVIIRRFKFMGHLYRGVYEVGREVIKWPPCGSRRRERQVGV